MRPGWVLLLDLASDLAPLLEGQAVNSRLQLLSHLLTVCLGQAVHNATLHPPHAVHKLVTDHASNVLHAVSKLGLLLPHLIPTVPTNRPCCMACFRVWPCLVCSCLVVSTGWSGAGDGWQKIWDGVHAFRQVGNT